MNAFRVGEVEVDGQIVSKLLFELNVGRVDPRVSVILAKHANRRERRKSTQWWNIHDIGPRWQSLTVATAKGRSACNTELLDTVVCDRTNLRQHVLPAVKDTGVCS